MQVEEFYAEVSAYLDAQSAREGFIPLPVRNIGLVRTVQSKRNDGAIYAPLLALVLNGRKDALYGSRSVAYGAGDLLIIGQTAPILASSVTATPSDPFVALYVEIDLQLVRSLAGEVGALDTDDSPARGVEVGAADAELVAAMARLFRLHSDPIAEQALAGSTLREVLFHALRSRHGGNLRQMMNIDSKASRIARAIVHIRKEYRSQIRATDLAAIAGMSASVFYENFREVTANSPLQFQKDLRLLEARDLLVQARQPVSQIAYEVGYDSAAQFSREFTRKFGGSPRSFLGGASQ